MATPSLDEIATKATKQSRKNAPGMTEDSVTRRAKWAAMKEEFLELCITGKPVHWPTLAAKYGKSYQTARNKASEEKWYKEVEERSKARNDVLEQKMTERTTLALDALNKDFATSEEAIRKRHATIARGLQVRAVQRLKEIDLKDLSAKDCIAMLQFGMKEERFALGLPETASPTVADTGSLPTEYKSVTELVGGFKRTQLLGTRILQALQGADLTTEDVEPHDPTPKGPRDVSDGSMQVTGKRGGKAVIVKRKWVRKTQTEGAES